MRRSLVILLLLASLGGTSRNEQPVAPNDAEPARLSENRFAV
jgi:hypothetical protein